MDVMVLYKSGLYGTSLLSLDCMVHLQERQEERPHFRNRLGLICSCLGSVVGTGNIWRFPRILATNSGEQGKPLPHRESLLCGAVFITLSVKPCSTTETALLRIEQRSVKAYITNMYLSWTFVRRTGVPHRLDSVPGSVV